MKYILLLLFASIASVAHARTACPIVGCLGYFEVLAPPPGNVAVTGTNASAPLAARSLVASGNGRLLRVDVTVAGSGPGSVEDAGSVDATDGVPLVAQVPNQVGTYILFRQYSAGLVVKPGTGQTLQVFYK